MSKLRKVDANERELNICMRKCHIGPLPPPLGGISVYLYRLQKLKPDDRYVNSVGLRKIEFLKLLCQKREVVVLHDNNIKRLTAAYFFSLFLGLQYSFVVHSAGVFRKKTWISWYFLRKSLQRAISIQFVSQRLQDRMKELFPEVVKHSFVQHAFLPPPLEDENKIYDTYKPELLAFIKRCSPLLVANASKLVFWEDGNEVYGLDMCVELVQRLKSKYPCIGLVFALADDGGESDYFRMIEKKIAENNLDENIFFMIGQRELWPLFRQADLMIRPTCTDGDALSIREARYFNVPTLSSDVAPRPDGTIVFNNRDMNDFYEKASEILSRKDFPPL